MRDDEEGLEKAFRAAVENPIDRFIRTFPTSYDQELVRARHRVLVETNWRREATRYVKEHFPGSRKGGEPRKLLVKRY